MNGAATKSRSRKRAAAEDGSGESPRTDVETPMAAAAAASAAPGPAAAGAQGPAEEAAAAPTVALSAEADQQTHASAGVELLEQMRKKQRRSPLLSSPLDRLATVELQLCLQFLDKRSKLIAARCNRQLLQAADQPFAWQGPSVSVWSRGRPQLGSLIRQSLLRHASIALTLESRSDMPAAEVAAIPRLRGFNLVICYRILDDLAPQLLPLPSLQGLQTLRVFHQMKLSALPLMPTLPALHTLECWLPDAPADWSWLPAMPALTDLDLMSTAVQPIPQTLIEAIGSCIRLQSLGMRFPRFSAGAFARLCSTSAMRQLRQLKLDFFQALGARLNADEYRSAFSCLAALESLRLRCLYGVDLLLPHLAHAPALRTLVVSCGAEDLRTVASEGATHPSREALRQPLAAAPLLEVRLEVAVTIEKWRRCFWYSGTSLSQRKQMDDQWSELQRMGMEMERVTVVEPDITVFF